MLAISSGKEIASAKHPDCIWNVENATVLRLAENKEISFIEKFQIHDLNIKLKNKAQAVLAIFTLNLKFL